MYNKRPTSEEILKSINREKDKENFGKLKIFFGYAAGVGKTYSMLQAAHEAQRSGKNVLVGYIEKHTRPETLALLEGLKQLPNKEINYKGVILKELDLDKALEIKPELILVDELAHSNAQGCRHSKRYQDIQELLRNGIDVYTTVNVQHLESLHDIVSAITNISVKERVPDFVFDLADQVEVVDIEPDDLIERLEAGKIYKLGQAQRALKNFFTKNNLSALREIALRRTADRLNKTAQKEGNEQIFKAGEHILICLSSSPSNAKVIRTAARMAEAFHGEFTALFVETIQTKELKGDNLKRLRENLKLAEQLGAQIATVYGDDPAVQIAEYSKISGITKIVLGRTNHRQLGFWKVKTLADKLIELANDIDVYIIPDQQPIYKKKINFFNNEYINKLNLWDTIKSAVFVFIASIIGLIFYVMGLSESNIVMVYILCVLISSIVIPGHVYGVITSIFSVISFNFLFTRPRFTLHADVEHFITFFTMLITSIISSSLAARVKKQARQSAQKAYYNEILMTTNRKLRQGRDELEIIKICASQLNSLLKRPILFSTITKDEKLNFDVWPPEKSKEILNLMNTQETAVAEWVRKNNKHAGATTNTLSNAENYYLSVRGVQEVMAVVGIPLKNYPGLDTFEKNLLIYILNECGIIMERSRLSLQNKEIELETKQEKLRSNLLRSISHDLRTPLTSISGNAGILMEQEIVLTEDKKQELYRSIYDDSMWLVNLTENLLSTTKIENGTVSLKLEPELLEDVFNEALKHVDRNIKDYNVSIELCDDLLMAKMDVKLIIQVIVNIVNNAVKYTPKGTNIILKAEKKEQMVYISISDNGPGVDDATKKHLFDMFYTAVQEKSDDRRGLGLGLNLCRSIVTAHGGNITVTDNIPKGCVFTFTLPLEEVNINNV